MKFTIIGAGAIGGLAGAYMTRAGHDVLLVDRSAPHVEAMKAKGLFIEGVRGTLTVPVRATTPERLRAPLEAVLLATQSQHTLEAVHQILPLMTADTFIVSYQNGFNEPDIQRLMNEARLDGARQVLGSIPNYGGAVLGPGHLEFVHEGPIQLGEMDGADTPRLRELARCLSAVTKVELSDHIWAQIWTKEVYSAQGLFCGLVDAHIRETLGVERWARIAAAIVREALLIAEANGIEVQAVDFFDPANYKPVTPADTRRLLDNMGAGISWNIVYRHRASEVRSSNGKLVEYGREVGADVRLNERLCTMIDEIERGTRSLGFHNYEELETYVAGIGRSLP
jgi:2-dehydropantoate 2-reductase